MREWIKSQQIPVFAVGNYNFDYSISNGTGNDAYDIMFEGSGVTWVEPQTKVRTEDSHNSILDFALVNDLALAWSPKSSIIVRDDEFVPANKKSDHRPITAVFVTPWQAVPPLVSRAGNEELLRNEARRVDLFRDGTRETEVAPELREEGRSLRRDLIINQIELIRNQLDLLESLLRENHVSQ